MLFVSIFEFFLLFNRPWMIRSILAALLIGVIGGIIGCYIILNRMIFLGEAVAHSAFAGAALGILLGVNPLVFIFAFSEISAVSVGYVNQKKIMNEDIVIGIIFSGMMGLGIIILSFMDEFSASVSSILFGAILIISSTQLVIMTLISIVVLIIILFLRNEYKFIVFDREMARVSGLPVKKLDYLFLLLVGAIITISLNAIGAILVFAMFIMPSAASYMWTFNFKKMLILSSAIGMISGFLGIMISYLFILPGGPSIVLIATIFFVVSYLFSPKRKARALSPMECKFCKIEEKPPLEHPIGIDVPHYHVKEEGKIFLKVDLSKQREGHKWKGHRPLIMEQEDDKSIKSKKRFKKRLF
ncbi:MAG: metal ABC transporter permease [Promethearchaeota archaeon]